MTSIHWAWAAVLAEVSLAFSPLILDNSLLALLGILTLHSVASAIVAGSTFLFLPRRFRQPRFVTWLLMFNFAFIAPVVGAIGMLLLTRFTLKKKTRRLRMAVPVSIALPEFDVQTKEIHHSGSGAVRSRLAVNVPDDIRMQSLLTLQAAPQRVANPILEDLLGDATDDVRLVAFGMLDAKETQLFTHIKRERNALLEDLSLDQRYACLAHLAELHWELVYAGLAQGELLRHVLNQALKYLDAALALDLPPSCGLVFLKGRILLARHDSDGAEVHIKHAMALGQPLISVLPYLAEIAFNKRDFASLRPYMQQLVNLNIAGKNRALADIWTGRDNVSNLSDRRYLPHI